jgi:uncharacterized protein YqgQ
VFFTGFSDGIMYQVIQQKALTRLLVEKGIFSKEEFLEMVKILDWEIWKEKKGRSGNLSFFL